MTTEENKPALKQWRYRMRSDRRRKQQPRFEIAAAVVFRLGEELITDVVQALVELVKNSYDADATSHISHL